MKDSKIESVSSPGFYLSVHEDKIVAEQPYFLEVFFYLNLTIKLKTLFSLCKTDFNGFSIIMNFGIVVLEKSYQ